MMRLLLIAGFAFLGFCSGACRQAGRSGIAEIRGAAWAANTLYAWGDGVLVQAGGGTRVRAAGRKFAAAGCLADLDDKPGLVLQEGTNLVWLHGPEFTQTTLVDTEAGLSDCQSVTLLGHRGVLAAHRGLQVRFYERPADGAGRWPYREIYSFYTPSYQSGLLLHDVDRDGHPDILCGNYWIQSPAVFEMPWRLFAIHTYNDSEHAAHVRLGLWGDRLVVAQGEIHPAKLAVFRPPADRKQLWTEQRLDADLGLHQPAALAASARGFAVGERGGKGRILLWDGHASGRVLAEGAPVVALFWDGPDLIAVRRNGIQRSSVPLQ